MFERLIKELQDLERNKIKIPVSTDKDGYVDRECPNENCLFQFKVLEEDWLNICRDEQIFCPMCRHEANSGSWWTQEQLAHARDEGYKYIHSRVGVALAQGARDFNASQPRNAFLSLKMTYSGPSQPVHIMLPIPASEEMTLKVKCKKCSTRYSVIGSAFFCPSCGHNAAEETFDSSMLKIDAKMKNLPVVRKAIEEVSKDEAETTCRSLIESSLNECVVAFQRFCEVTFCRIAPNQKVKFNAFQNLETGGEYWKSLFNESYVDWLSHSEFEKLNILFQQRHLLSHTEGIVDSKYVERSGDKNYKEGQRLVIREKDVKTIRDLVTKIVNTIRIRTV